MMYSVQIHVVLGTILMPGPRHQFHVYESIAVWEQPIRVAKRILRSIFLIRPTSNVLYPRKYAVTSPITMVLSISRSVIGSNYRMIGQPKENNGIRRHTPHIAVDSLSWHGSVGERYNDKGRRVTCATLSVIALEMTRW